MKPGIHTLSTDTYHADPCDTPSLSASIAHLLVTASAAHARANHPKLTVDHKRETEEKFDVGTCVHSLLLEGVDLVEIVHADSWRTKWAQEAKADARAHGRIPLLPNQGEAVLAMVDAVRKQIAELDVDPLPLTGGRPEQTLVWQEDDVACRARVDWLHSGYAYVDDVKTTSRLANPEGFSKSLFSLGYDLKAAFYLRGLKALTGVDAEFRWLVIETSPPYALSVVSPGPDVLELGEAKVEWALNAWRECLTTDRWPSYPTRVCYADVPGYEEARWLERVARSEMAA